MITWTDEKKRRLTELVCAPEQYSESQMARALTDEFGEEFSRDAVHNKITDLDLRSLINRPITNIMPYYSKYKDIIDNDQDTIEKIIDIQPNQVQVIINKSKLKILHLGDLHIPFQNDEQVQEAINRNLSADVVVLSEIADCYSVSRFNKNMSVPFEVEIDNIVRYFEYLSATFPLIIVMGGNHLNRINRNFIHGVPPSLLMLVKDNLLKLLAKPFSNIVVVDLPILQVNDTVFTHAEFFSKTDLKAGVNAHNFLNEWKESLDIKNYRLMIQQHCLSEDTEILTKDGWKYRDDIHESTEVLTLNTTSDRLEYNKVNKVFTYDNYDSLLSFKGRKDFDLLTTADHRLIYKTDGAYGECKAKDLKSSYKIPLAGFFDGEKCEYSDDFLRLLGLFIAEGSFLTDNDTSGLRLWQSWENRSVITNVLDNLGYEYNVTKKNIKGRRVGLYASTDDEAVIYISAKSSTVLHKVLKGKKNIPKELMNITKEQFLCLLDGLMLGGGHYYAKRNGGQFATTNKSLADNLQELCVKHGFKSTINTYKSGIAGSVINILTWLDKRFSTFHNKIETVPYTGIAWCVNVDNGTIVIRRNGKTAIVGNTHMLGATYRNGGNLKIMESGCLCRIPDYAVDNFYSKPQTNGYIVIIQKDGVTDLDMTREFCFASQKYIPKWNPAGGASV